MKTTYKLLLCLSTVLLQATSLLADGSISGYVKQKISGNKLSSINIVLKNTKYSTISNEDGFYKIDNIKPGKYTLVVNHEGFFNYSQKVTIKNGIDQQVDIEIEPFVFHIQEIMIYGATKRLEKITESPSAVNVLYSRQLETLSRGNQIASSLSGLTGVEILKSGATDYIVNTRGFNNGLNRRVLVLQDGRDVSMPLLGAIEWNSFSYPVDDYSKIEFIRGPAASLYGANAFNGVLSLTSHSPREVLGTRVSLTGGDYKTYRLDVRHADVLGKFSYKINLGRSQSLNLARRRDSVKFLEYEGLALESRPIYDDERNTFSNYGTLRFDYDFNPQQRITLEGGYANNGNETFVFGLGRTLVKDTERPYIRLEYNSENINFHTHYMKRSVKDTMWLLVPRANGKPGAPLLDNSDDLLFDAQYNFYPLKSNKSLHLIFGASQQFQNIRTSGTSIPDDVHANYTGIYGQLNWGISDKFKIVSSARFDRTNIHEDQLSPRIAFVYSLDSKNQFRISLSRSFQRPNYSELFRLTPDAPAFKINNPGPPVPALIGINQIVADSIATLTGNPPPQINLNLSGTRAFATGNDELKVEKNLGIEAGYKGSLNDNLYVTFDAYYNYLNYFITNFLPGVNKNFKKWNADLDPGLEQYNELATNIVYSKLSPRDQQRLSYYNGVPAFIVSNANVGKVNQYGIELGFTQYFTNEILLSGNYSYYHFDVDKEQGDPDLLPNTSPHKLNFSFSYIVPQKYDATLSFQYSHEYDWLAGAYIGEVPTYSIFNFNAGAYIFKNLQVGININNVFNQQYYEIFGGTYLPRYTTARLSYSF